MVVLVWGAALSLACNGSPAEGSSEPPALDPASCVEVAPTGPLRFGGAGTFWGEDLAAGIDVDLGGGGYHRLSIRFRGATEPGTHALTAGENAAFSTCRHCVMLMENVWGDNVNTLHFQASGTIELEAVDDARGEYRGVVRDVMMIPVEPTGLHRWGGFSDTERCVYLREARFDTFAGVGEPCVSTRECRNHATQVCDPQAGECIESACDPGEGTGCDDASVCVEQSDDYGTGACFPRCAPFTSGACGPGFECASIDYAGEEGVCRRVGEAARGEPCEASTSSTGCVEGSVCQTWSPFWGRPDCYEMCDYFAAEPGCTDGRRCWMKLYRDKDFALYCGRGHCHVGGTCRLDDGRQADPAAIGEPCEGDRGTPCADDGRAARGFCHDDGICRRVCRLGASDCDVGACTQLTIANGGTEVEGVGVCL